jgi:hypothetical protein
MKNTKLLFKVTLISIVFVLICFNLCSCLLLYALTDDRDLKFLHTESEIETIEIVEIAKLSYNLFDEGAQTVITTVEDTTAFMSSLKAIKGRYTDQCGIGVNYVDVMVVRITYLNGDRDLIHHSGQTVYVQEDGCYYDRASASLDKEDYSKLIKEYVPDADEEAI